MSVIDLEAALEFWEMKEEIEKALTRAAWFAQTKEHADAVELLFNKIESLGKKENLDEK